MSSETPPVDEGSALWKTGEFIKYCTTPREGNMGAALNIV
jgi:hypothetical protein